MATSSIPATRTKALSMAGAAGKRNCLNCWAEAAPIVGIHGAEPSDSASAFIGLGVVTVGN